MGRWNRVIAVLFCSAAAAQQPPSQTPSQTPQGVFRVGPDVLAPRLVQKQEPEYSEEARKAKLQGTVLLALVVGEDGNPRDLRVTRPLGMGLDENALAAVSAWRFQPGIRFGQPVAVHSTIEVHFRLLPDARSWHLDRASFVTQEGGTRPVIVSAPYPPPGADRYGSVSVSFDVDEQGRPINVHVDRSTGPDFEDEVLALIREWRFQAAMRNGIPIQVHGYLDFSHGIDPQAPVPQPGIRKK